MVKDIAHLEDAAMSTAEAEFMLVTALALEMIYLRRLLADLGLAMRCPTPVGEDNSACMEWTNCVVGARQRARHLELRVHHAHHALQAGEIRLYKVQSSEQLADILTRQLP